MNYSGLEIDMLSLGDADAVLVTRWDDGAATYVLIDGGNKGHADEVIAFLKARGVGRLDHLLCSHPHDDHAGGLVELIKSGEIQIGQAWVHDPEAHVDMAEVHGALLKAARTERAEIIQASLETAQDLISLLDRTGIPRDEPFAGSDIGFLRVCGPSEQYYEELLAEFRDADKIKDSDRRRAIHEAIEEELVKAGADKGLGDPPTSPENNSSTIVSTVHDSKKYLFTADAGVDALVRAKNAHDLADLRWMQIPHHGSQRNINEDLIAHFDVKTAFVSAAGSRKHPSRKVVNAFKNQGAKVYSTHYPNGGSLRHHTGTVPDRAGYSPATPLWEADK